MTEPRYQEGEDVDPRIVRSRTMLMDSLSHLLKTKEFEKISVGEIADHASLNRATFYLHYPEKIALLEAMTEQRFRDLLHSRAIVFSDCEAALRAIALGVCDYLTELTNCPVKGPLIPLEGSLIPVIENMLRTGLVEHGVPSGSDVDMIATTAAWALFGAARRWFRIVGRKPATEMAAEIGAMVSPMLASAHAGGILKR